MSPIFPVNRICFGSVSDIHQMKMYFRMNNVARIYDIVRNVVIPARISVLTIVLVGS